MTRRIRHRKPSHNTQTVEIDDQELMVGDVLWLVSGTLDITYVTELYGTDADGNRGELRTEEDERTFALTSACKAEGPDGDWGESLKGDAIPKDVQKAAWDYFEDFGKYTPPDPDPFEEDEPTRDEDDR